MTSKRSRRRQAGRQTQAAPTIAVKDGFQNVQARLGIGTGNLNDTATYVTNNPLSRKPRDLEAMYRGSWIVGAVVDAVADDMTRAGVDFNSTMPPDVIDAMTGAANALGVWTGISDTIRWGRLYGGAVGVLMIDGQDPESPLRAETVRQDQFKGIVAIDRWCMTPPSATQLVTDLGPDIGKPEFYDILQNAAAYRGKRVHHSRVIRHDGHTLPHYQRQMEQGWGLSVVERMFDRLLAFDSGTAGAAQLVHKAYLRTMKVKGLRAILAAGGPAEAALIKQVEYIRQFQQTEGLTLLDGEDDFDTHNYTFTGLDDILLQFGQQLSGATGIPMVRLYGQSPAGLNSTGESDLRNYYDGINARQNTDLRTPVDKVMDLLFRSVTGEAPPKGFGSTFNPLWQTSEKERSEIATQHTTAILAAEEQGVIDKPTALRELKQSSQVTGVFTNITDEMIETAANEPPLGDEDGLGDINQQVDKLLGTTDGAAADIEVQGLRLVIETPAGALRQGGEGLGMWQVTMPAHYGFILGTTSAEGPEEMDCYVGPFPESPIAWVIDQTDLETGEFDEHKVMLGYRSGPDAGRDYMASFSDGRGFDRMCGLTMVPIDQLRDWLSTGDMTRPITEQLG